MDNKEEVKIIEKRFYTHIFIMVILLGFLAVIYPHESKAEYNHPFYMYGIIGFLITLIRFMKDLIKAKKLKRAIQSEQEEIK